uniref:Uncharacterized protein n=1 Tax=Panagrolaimus sp. PS1159 TaxID=55785 RepID=A0AC35GC51_9BILA
MKNVFASATTLKLYADHFNIGWQNKLCKFPNNRIAILLLSSNDNRVDSIFIEEYIPEYQSIFDIKNLPILSSSLKNMTIPNCLMDEKFRDCFKLKSLAVTKFVINGFQYLKFCCKTDLLEFSSDFGIDQFFSDLDYLESSQYSPHLSSVKQITFNGCFFEQRFNLKCDKLMDCFSSIEIFKFNLTKPSFYRSTEFCHSYFSCLLKRNIKLFIDDIKKATHVSPKINVTEVGFLDFNNCKFICKNFDANESITDFYCFKKTIKSAGSESTVLEIQVAR